MQIAPVPFETTDWDLVEPTEHRGTSGTATWRTRHLGDLRVRMIDYSPDYLADHWCTKGHVPLCLGEELETETADERRFTLTPGMSYHVGDDVEAHRSSTATGARLFILD